MSDSGIKIKDLPDDVIDKLGSCLNSQREENWKRLAGLIGFSIDFIQHLKEFAKEATERILIQWAESEPDATAFELYTMLIELGREDAARLLLTLPVTNQSSTGEIA